jgi:uncharacterized protein YidB (DUF937 family)
MSMGLLGNVLTGMMNGPRGGGFGMPRGGGMFGGGGMSPIAAGVLGLLAYKAFKNFSAPPDRRPGAMGSGHPGSPPPSQPQDGGLFAGTPLDKILNPGALSGGLNDLVDQFRRKGKGEVAESWVSKGANTRVAPEDLEQVLSAEQIAFLMGRTGLSREELLAGLSQELPKAVDTLTPEGHVPTEDEMKRLA